MTSRARLSVFGAVFALALFGVSAGWAQDATRSSTSARSTMKAQGKALGAVKAFTRGQRRSRRGAQAAAPNSVNAAGEYPSHVPAKDRHGRVPRQVPREAGHLGRVGQVRRSGAAERTPKAKALNAALKSGDKAAITDRFRRDGQGGLWRLPRRRSANASRRPEAAASAARSALPTRRAPARLLPRSLLFGAARRRARGSRRDRARPLSCRGRRLRPLSYGR